MAWGDHRRQEFTWVLHPPSDIILTQILSIVDNCQRDKNFQFMDYYISPRFLEKLAIHITKNYLDLPGIKVPLILGVHGRKGEGKTFQCQLAFERMKLEVVHISAGELESPDAGDPARLLRLRYREAAELVKIRGKMCVLVIHDLDAGAGRFDRGTQYTVNTQLVNATLMHIADNPTNVQLPGSYDATPLPRIPIVVTGNDFTTLYAPLIRDGRMEKFYWEPTREDKLGIVAGIFNGDGLRDRDIVTLVDGFPMQAIDFFGAIRARIYDEQILAFIKDIGLDRLSSQVVNSATGKPTFPQPKFDLNLLLEFGEKLAREQEIVAKSNLVEEYNRIRYQTPDNRDSALPQPEFTPPPEYTPYRNANRYSSVTATNALNDGGDRSSRRVTPEIAREIGTIIDAGCELGIEYADTRHFKINSWQTYSLIPAEDLDGAIVTVEDCLREYDHHYIRLVAIVPQLKRRTIEKIIHRPN